MRYPRVTVLALLTFCASYIAHGNADIEAAAKKSKSVDEFLKNLPAKFKQNWTAVHTSGSQQSKKHATFANPRIIMHDMDSNLLAFDATDQTVEWIAFDKSKKEWKFNEVKFASKKPGHISPGTNCQSCHAGAPLWDGYPFWPGVYGAQDDMMAMGSKDLEEFKKFIQSAPGRERYKHLDVSGKKLVISERMTMREPGKFREFYDMPNSKLSHIINLAQADRFATQAVDKLPRSDVALLLYSLFNCTRNADLNEKVAEAIKDSNFDQLRREAYSSVPKQMKEANSHFVTGAEFVADNGEPDAENKITEVGSSTVGYAHEIAKRHNLPAPDTSTNFSHMFYRPVASPDDITYRLGKELLSRTQPDKLKEWESLYYAPKYSKADGKVVSDEAKNDPDFAQYAWLQSAELNYEIDSIEDKACIFAENLYTAFEKSKSQPVVPETAAPAGAHK